MTANIPAPEDYPRTAYINGKCINIIASLWHSPEREPWKSGAVTSGGSEECVLAGVSAWLRWRKERIAAGLSTDRPNLVISERHSPVWDSVALLWGIELRTASGTGEHAAIHPRAASDAYDADTVGVVVSAVAHQDAVREISELTSLLTSRGITPHIHIDAGRLGLRIPFEHPELRCDFRQPGVVSISADEDAGDPQALFPGRGWVVWRDRSLIPDGMTMCVNYLGEEICQTGLNFTRPVTGMLDAYSRYVRSH